MCYGIDAIFMLLLYARKSRDFGVDERDVSQSRDGALFQGWLDANATAVLFDHAERAGLHSQ